MDRTTIHPDTRLGPISLTVGDLARARRFYQDTLGMIALGRQDGTLALGVEGTGPLVALTEVPNARPRPPRTSGLYHFAILLPGRMDLARTLSRLANQGYPLQGAADHGVSEALYLADPDGNGIEIYIDRPRAEWRWQDGQLQMGTDPLNVRALLNQSDGVRNGLPPETRIGHVHLQVAHLNQAESFYSEVLGFELMQRYGPSALFLSAGGYHHHVGLNTWAGVGAPPPPPDAVGLRHFTIDLPDDEELARITERLQAADIPFEPVAVTHGAGAAQLVRDPSGNGIVLDVDRRG